MTKRYMSKQEEKGSTLSRTALFFKDEQMSKLHTLSAMSGAPVAELVRRAVDHYLDFRRSEWEATWKLDQGLTKKSK